MSQSPALPDARTAERSGEVDTKERLLDAAERLFSEHGFRGASMRAVTQAAGAALSAANYHFGSKEELLAAVLRRRLQPVNQRRLVALGRLEADAKAGRPVTLEALFDAFYRPSFERLREATVDGTSAMPRQVVARLYTEPPELVQPLRAELFGEVNTRFAGVLAAIFPELAERQLRMIVHLAVASMVHVLAGQLEDELTHELEADAADGEAVYESLLRILIAHSTGGARAIAAGVAVADGEEA